MTDMLFNHIKFDCVNEFSDGSRMFFVNIHGGEHWMQITDGQPTDCSFAEGSTLRSQIFEFLKAEGHI